MSGKEESSSPLASVLAGEPRDHAARVLDAIMDDAHGAMALFRGRALDASLQQGLVLEPVEIPEITRANVVVPVASTNDVKTLDAAAVRSARCDSIIEVGYPNRETAARLLSTYLDGVPGADDVELDCVAAHFGPETSGADIREIVRRTVLSSSGTVCTADLIATVKSGRFKPQMPGGNYL